MFNFFNHYHWLILRILPYLILLIINRTLILRSLTHSYYLIKYRLITAELLFFFLSYLYLVLRGYLYLIFLISVRLFALAIIYSQTNLATALSQVIAKAGKNINPYLSLSLGITLFSFAGVLPLIGSFAKQMVLSAALDNGYVFMALLAILTSVISAVYYLNVIKNIFFFKEEYKINPSLENLNLQGNIVDSNSKNEKVSYKLENIVLSSALSIVISILTLILLLFIYIPNEWFSIANILTLILFKP